MHATMRAAIAAAGDTIEEAAEKLDYHPNYLRSVLNGRNPLVLKLARRFASVYPAWRPVGVAAFGYLLDAGQPKKIPVAS